MAKLTYTFKHDLAFKMFFVKHEELLKRLVALMLHIPLDSIQKFEVTNGEIPPEDLTSKFCRLDIHMVVDGRRVDLEVQVNSQGDYINRAVFYGGREISLALASGRPYIELAQSIIISIINFKLWRTDKVHTIFMPKEIASNESMTDRIVWHFFELPKLSECDDVTDELEAWLKLFDAESDEEIAALERLEVPTVNHAINAFRSYTATSEFQHLAQMREDALRNEASALAYERHEGRQEGRQEGLAETILRMGKKNKSLADIMDAVDMPRAEIEAILARHVH